MEQESFLNNSDAVQQEPAQEKMVSASRVEEIVKETKLKAVEKAKRELSEQYRQEIDELKAAIPKSVGGMQAPNVDEIYQQVESRLLERARAEQEAELQSQRERQASDIASSYYGKMQKGAEIAEDFEQITADFNPNEFPRLIALASKFDNLPDIIYELSKNPYKLENLDSMTQKSPQMATKMLQELSDSIESNKRAKNIDTAPAPLSRTKPSSSAGADSGKMGIKDYKKASWLKV
jgi:hypothetical protein